MEQMRSTNFEMYKAAIWEHKAVATDSKDKEPFKLSDTAIFQNLYDEQHATNIEKLSALVSESHCSMR